MACLPTERLRAWAAGAPPADADEDRAHLEACPQCRATLALSRTMTMDQTATAPAPPPTTQRRRGQTVGRYVIVEVLGAGGMGIVYAAYDPELDRKVALKILHEVDGSEASQAIDRLKREAQAMARLRHPHLIDVYDVGTQPGELFVAMALVDGGTLTAWLRERKRTWREIVAVYRQAGAGLAAAHDAGLVHRDFKPDNVLVSRTGEVVVTDFGLARALGTVEPAANLPIPLSGSGRRAQMLDTPLTATGALVGTPIYMAPELFHGATADARADVYSFSAALFEALFGKRPFSANTLEELREAIATGRPAVPDRSRCPGWLLKVVLRGLAIDPAERYPSMRDMLADLGRDPRARWRKLGLVAGALATLGALGLGQQLVSSRRGQLCQGAERKLAGVWDAARKAEVSRAFLASGRPNAQGALRNATSALDRFASEWTRTHIDACEATRLRGEQSEEMLDLRMACLSARLAQGSALADLFAHADASLVDRATSAASALEPPSSCSAERLLQGGERLPASGPARERAREVSEGIARAKAHLDAGKYKIGEELIGAALASAERERLAGAAAEARYYKSLVAHHLGRFDEAVAGLGRSASDAIAAGRDDVAARALSFLGFLQGSLQRHFDVAHLSLDLAGASLRRVGNRPELEAYRQRQLASVLANERKLDEAVAAFRRGIELQRTLTGDSSLQMAEMHLGLSRALTEAGRPAEALVAIQHACDMFERLFGRDYPILVAAQLQLGYILRKLDRRDEAIAALRKGLELREATSGAAPPAVVEALVQLGDALKWAGKPAEAVPVLERAVELGERIKTPYPDVPSALAVLSEVLGKLGQPRRAEEALERALAHPKVGELPDIGELELGLAKLVRARGDRRRSAALVEQARAHFDKEPPDERKKHLAELAVWLRSR